MKTKRVLSMLIVLTVVVGMLTGITVSAAVTGTTAEIFNLNFEDGVRLPKFNYGGTEYATTLLNDYGIKINEDVFGNVADKCLGLSMPENRNDTTFVFVPNVPAINDIGGGTAVVSWEMAATNNSLAEPNIAVYVRKKNAANSYADQTVTFKYSGTYTFFGSGANLSGSNQMLNTGNYTRPGEEWNKYDLVFKYGSNEIVLYKNGAKLYSVSGNAAFGEGYTFAGLGRPDYNRTLQITMSSKNDTGKICAYYDDIKVRTYDSSEVFVPAFVEKFSSATDNSVSGAYLNRVDADFVVESGVFGKAANDKSIKIVRKENATSGSKDNFYQKTNYGTFNQNGIVHIGVNLALDGYDRNCVKFISVKPAGGTQRDLLYMVDGNIQGANAEKVAVNWESGKWYNFDLYITPGNGSNVKNKMTVYMNGKKMLENIELADYSFTGIDTVRIGQRERFIDGNHQYNNAFYIDDVKFDYYPSGITPNYPDVTLSVNDETANSKVVDTDTIIVYNPEMTVEQLSGLVTSNVPVSIVKDADTKAAPSDKAVGCYVLAKASDDSEYIFPVVSKVKRYSEDFSEYALVNNSEILNWSGVSGGGATKGVYGLNGKSSVDQSFVFSTGNIETGTRVEQITNYNYESIPLKADGKVTIEFSWLMSDADTFDDIAFQYKYKNAQGELVNAGITNLIWLYQNNIYAFTGANTNLIIGSYAENQWNKYAIEIDTKAFTADIYINGKLVKENVKIISGKDITGCEITEIYRFKMAHTTANTVAGAYSAVDDFELYLGKYNNDDDLINISSTDYIVKNNWIAIPEETTSGQFNSSIAVSGAQRTVMFDDSSITTSMFFDKMKWVGHDQYMALESEGGAIHYYRIVEQNRTTELNGKAVISNGKEITSGAELVKGIYTLNLEYEKYNNTEEKGNAILAVYNGDKLVDVEYAEFDYVFGANESQIAQLDVKEDGLKLKAMIWTNGIKPLETAADYGVVSGN